MGNLVDQSGVDLYAQVLELLSSGWSLTQIALRKNAEGQRLYPSFVELLSFFEDPANTVWHARYKKALVLQMRAIEYKTQDFHDYLYQRCLKDKEDIKIETLLKFAKTYADFAVKRRDALSPFLESAVDDDTTTIRFEYVGAGKPKKNYGFRPIEDDDEEEEE